MFPSSKAPALAILLLACSAEAQNVVGLPGAHRDVFVAVRGLLPAGTQVSGIEFFSNDATVFPEICLMSESRGGRLPAPGSVLRTVAGLAGRTGLTTATWEPYTTQEDEHLWAVIRFPDNAPMVARGLGGGPGIGWRAERVLADERSLYSVGGALNEFCPAFDLTFVVAEAASQAKTSEGSGKAGELSELLKVAAVRTNTMNEIRFQFQIGRIGLVKLDLFDVAGRRLQTTSAGPFSPGDHDLLWDCRDNLGRSVPSGIYFYSLRSGGVTRVGKFVRVE